MEEDEIKARPGYLWKPRALWVAEDYRNAGERVPSWAPDYDAEQDELGWPQLPYQSKPREQWTYQDHHDAGTPHPERFDDERVPLDCLEFTGRQAGMEEEVGTVDMSTVFAEAYSFQAGLADLSEAPLAPKESQIRYWYIPRPGETSQVGLKGTDLFEDTKLSQLSLPELGARRIMLNRVEGNWTVDFYNCGVHYQSLGPWHYSDEFEIELKETDFFNMHLPECESTIQNDQGFWILESRMESNYRALRYGSGILDDLARFELVVRVHKLMSRFNLLP